MDGATLLARVNSGYARAAKRVGFDYLIYRPLDERNALNNLIGTVKAGFDSSPSYGFRRPNEYGDASWYALVDPDAVEVGDYLVGNDGTTYFIAAMQPLLPILAIACNTSVRIARSAKNEAIGAIGYGGLTAAKEKAILGSQELWPASVILMNQSRSNSTTPSSVPDGSWHILLPPSAPIEAIAGDIITDASQRRFFARTAEKTDLGMRLIAVEAHS